MHLEDAGILCRKVTFQGTKSLIKQCFKSLCLWLTSKETKLWGYPQMGAASCRRSVRCSSLCADDTFRMRTHLHCACGFSTQEDFTVQTLLLCVTPLPSRAAFSSLTKGTKHQTCSTTGRKAGLLWEQAQPMQQDQDLAWWPSWQLWPALNAPVSSDICSSGLKQTWLLCPTGDHQPIPMPGNLPLPHGVNVLEALLGSHPESRRAKHKLLQSSCGETE